MNYKIPYKEFTNGALNIYVFKLDITSSSESIRRGLSGRSFHMRGATLQFL